MPIGTLKWFNLQKGFGCIQPQDGGRAIFVHISAVEYARIGTLNNGQKISYELTWDSGKESAADLAFVA